MIKVNLEGRKTIEDIHKSLAEEKQIDEEMAYRIEKFIEYENKVWILNHKDDIVGAQGTESITAKDYLVANKLTEIVDDVNLDDIDTFNAVSKSIEAYYDSITQENAVEFKNSIMVGDKVVNCCKNLESYIINMDEKYADYLDERVDWFYENYTEYASRKAKEEEPEKSIAVSEPVVEPRKAPVVEGEEDLEEDFEEEIEEPEEVKEINTLSEWVLELGKYVVEDNKLVKRL